MLLQNTSTPKDQRIKEHCGGKDRGSGTILWGFVSNNTRNYTKQRSFSNMAAQCEQNKDGNN